MKNQTRLLLVLAVGVVFGGSLTAAPILGALDVSGDGVRVTGTLIDFLPLVTGVGNIRYQGPTMTGSFAGVALTGTLGTLGDLPSTYGSGSLAVPVNNYIVFNSAYGAALDQANFILDYLIQGNIGPNNPINLFQVGPDVFGGVSMGGRVQSVTGDWSAWTGSFTTQFGDTTIADVVSAAQTTGIQSSWSATFTATAIPEPGTIGMVVLGGLLIGAVRWYRRRPS